MHHYQFIQSSNGVELQGFPDAIKVLGIPPGADTQRMTDLALHEIDLRRASDYLTRLNDATCTDPMIREALWHSAIVRFNKRYMSGVRKHLNVDDIHTQPGARVAFDYFDALRDMHIAHDVNAYARCLPAAVLNKKDCARKVDSVSCITLFAETVIRYQRTPRRASMQSIRMHVDGDGVTWAMAKCRICGEVHKYRMSDVHAAPVKCKSCARSMEIRGTVIEASWPGD